jgi:hypothetical protein
VRRADGVKSLYQMIKIREQRRDGRRRVLERRSASAGSARVRIRQRVASARVALPVQALGRASHLNAYLEAEQLLSWKSCLHSLLFNAANTLFAPLPSPRLIHTHTNCTTFLYPPTTWKPQSDPELRT